MEAQTAGVGYIENREAILRRLARIEGQVRGLGRMVSEEAYCVDVLTQLAAVSKALDRVGFEVLSDHTNHCVRDAVESGGPEAEQRVAELLEAVERFARTR
jgi:DNA-binding FrmR family transcriptional regulator